MIEVLIGIIIAGIFATFAIPAYQNTIEDQKSRLCQARLLSLKAALDIYVIDNNVVPGTLSSIPQSLVDREFARVLGSKGSWKFKFALFLEKLEEQSFVYADSHPTSGDPCSNLTISGVKTNTNEEEWGRGGSDPEPAPFFYIIS